MIDLLNLWNVYVEGFVYGYCWFDVKVIELLFLFGYGLLYMMYVLLVMFV